MYEFKSVLHEIPCMYEASGWSCESSVGGLFRQEGREWIRFSYIDKQNDVFYCSEEIFDKVIRTTRKKEELPIMRNLRAVIKKFGSPEIQRDYQASFDSYQKYLETRLVPERASHRSA